MNREKRSSLKKQSSGIYLSNFIQHHFKGLLVHLADLSRRGSHTRDLQNMHPSSAPRKKTIIYSDGGKKSREKLKRILRGRVLQALAKQNKKNA